MSEPTIFQKSVPGRRSRFLPDESKAYGDPKQIPVLLRRTNPPRLPEVSELDVVRHYVRLSQKNFSIETNFYPLGSCTMKYNPKVNDQLAQLAGFAALHPLAATENAQGVLKLLHDLEQLLCELCGVARFTLQPAAGAQGEFTGLQIIRAYLSDQGNPRRRVLVPDSAHGTNPATAALCGYEVVSVKSNARGMVDVQDLRSKMSEEVAALMLTNPNTLGLFEEEILEIAEVMHARGGLLYYDGANLNALLTRARPGDMGFDVVHVNLHKTFSTPHGGGGPGSGPVGVKEHLVPYLPTPTVEHRDGVYTLEENRPKSIGKLQAFYGNVLIAVRAYAYILNHGRDGLRDIAEKAVLNANYLLARLADVLDVPYGKRCMHEFVATLKPWKEKGVSAKDVAKRLLDYSQHAPTVYFPLIVPEAFMVEPTETESKETLDAFVKAMHDIYDEVTSDKEKVLTAPHSTPVSRLDEVSAARNPVVREQW